MNSDIQWRYEKMEKSWAVVADNLPGYRAEIWAVVPAQGHKRRVWTIHGQQQVIARGATSSTALAKGACAIYLRVAKELPLFDRLPSLDRTTVS